MKPPRLTRPRRSARRSRVSFVLLLDACYPEYWAVTRTTARLRRRGTCPAAQLLGGLESASFCRTPSMRGAPRPRLQRVAIIAQGTRCSPARRAQSVFHTTYSLGGLRHKGFRFVMASPGHVGPSRSGRARQRPRAPHVLPRTNIAPPSAARRPPDASSAVRRVLQDLLSTSKTFCRARPLYPDAHQADVAT